MSEFRKDLVSGDWIIVAPERAKRPHELLPEKKKRAVTPKSVCPFEDLKKSGNLPLIAAFPNVKNWKIAVIPNKYPALRHSATCSLTLALGPYRYLSGIGQHDLVIVRNHEKNLMRMTLKEGVELFQCIQKRYQELIKDSCLLYTSTFFNWGASAGASLYHPHYQMLTLPIVPPNIQHSLNGSVEYFKVHRRCVHCDMLKFELKHKKRIIAKNSGAVALAPYFSRQPFEIHIFPLRHQPYFEKTPEQQLKSVVAVLQAALRKIRKNLHDPDLNFFIHTAPLKHQSRYKHYHWHIEIIPKISLLAGFELGTGVDINVVDPDSAAKILRR